MLIICLILVVTMVLGVSYALLTKNIVGSSNKVIYKIGDLDVKLDDSSSKEISLTNAIPQEDSEGLSGEPYSFLLINNGTTDLKYTIYLEDDKEAQNKCGTDCELVPYKFIRYNLANDSELLKTSNLSTTSNALYTGRIKSKATDKFNLRVWLSIGADNTAMNKYYFGKIKVVVGQGDSYCKDNGFNTLSDCMLVMNNHETSVETAKQNIVSKGIPDFSKTATTDEGLFMAEDDDGASYYYRGAVKNNYVSFAGFIWRIIRQNGDGSIRMIYAGKKTNDTGKDTIIGSSSFNNKYWDPTYVGYKYNEDFSLHEDNEITENSWFFNTQKYLYGTGYSFDESTKKFILTGNLKELIWDSNHEEIINNQLYSCLNTNCNVAYKVTGYVNSKIMTVQPISYSSKSLISAQTNTTDSDIKIKLDNWYEENLIDYSQYLANETFCNDRSIFSGTGYKVDSSTYYGSYNRLIIEKTPSLKCNQENDQFRVSGTSVRLNYPIGLIIGDEVSFAGGVYSETNTDYYLYNNTYYWSFTPVKFTSNHTYAYVATISSTGDLSMDKHITDSYGVKPVINLKPDVKIISGDGTSMAPYKID